MNEKTTTEQGPELLAAEPRPVVEQVKDELQTGHRAWLRENDTISFYDNPLHRWRVERILELAKDIEGDVLDVGCFVGAIAEGLQKQGNKRVVGMDCLEEALEHVRRRGVRAVQGDLDDGVIPFADESFDLVLATDVLNSVYDPDSAVHEIQRVLKPGGQLIITLPNLAGFGNRMLMLFGKPPHNLQVRAREGVGHLRLFTFWTLERLLRDHGYEIERKECITWCWPFMRFSFRRIPILNKIWKKKPEYDWGPLHYSRTLAKILPKLGENMLFVVRKPAK